MNSFLNQAAQHIVQQHGNDLHDIAVIVPGKRAALFLKRELSQVCQGPVIAPKISILPEFLKSSFNLDTIPTFESLLHLYTCYSEINPSENFETFIKWGIQALEDFNDVDQYLYDYLPGDLFKNIQDIHEIENWSLQQEPRTEIQNNFLEFWKKLGELYTLFSSSALQNKKQNYAQLCRSLTRSTHPLPFGLKKIYAIGLSSLTTAEERILDQWAKSNLLEFLWDVDQFYVDNPVHEAGKFFRKRREKSKLGIHNALKQGDRNIQLVETSTAMGMILKLQSDLEKLSQEEIEKTVVVVPDSKLLQSLISGIKLNSTINVAMGWPMKNTSLFSLCTSYLNLCKNKLGQDKIYFRDVFRFLEQPAIRPMSDAWREDLRAEIVRKRKVYLKEQDWVILSESFPQIQSFLPYIQTAISTSSEYMEIIHKLLADIAIDNNSEDITKEIALQWLDKWTRLQSLLSTFPFLEDLSNMEILMQHVMANEQVAFEGEPLEGLQVLGMVETRALDFERVLFLQATDDVMPGSPSFTSLIPFDLRKAMQLPLPADRDASYAYNFYRLLHHAKDMVFYYPQISSDFRGSEKSRYLQQLNWEWRKHNPTIHWREIHVMHEGSAYESREESIPNDAFSKMKIKAKLESGISPSALSKYLQCPLDFYYRYVLGLGEVKDMEEELDAASIGSAVHRVLEKWMEPLAKNQEKITAEHIAIWKAQLQSAVIQAMQEGDQDFEKSGFNLLAFEAACKMVERVIQYEGQQLSAGIHSKLIAVEAGLNYKLQSNQDYTIHIIGKIDRIHQQNDQWIVLDYKTGKVKKDDLSTKHGLSKEFVAGGKKSKLMQVLIYAFLVNQCYGIPVESIEAGLFPLASKENMPLFIANKELFPVDFKEKMEEILLDIANEMIERPDFTHNPQASHCQFCRDRAV